MTISTEMSENRKRKAREYAAQKRVLTFAGMGLMLAYLLVWLFSGWSLDLRRSLESWSDNQWVIVPVYGAIFGLIYSVITFPLSFYGNWVLPRKYDLSNQTLLSYFIDLLKGGTISAIFGFLLIELLYLGLRALPEWWWLAGGVVYLLLVVVLANLAPVIIMPLFNKFIPLENDELRERLMRLGEKTGARVRGVYIIDFSRRTKQANAFVAGLGNTRRIVLGDTLTKHYTSAEIETVMAHELGHHVHGDIWRGILYDSAITLVGLFIASLAMSAGISAFGFREVGDVAALPLLALVIFAFGLVTMPLVNGYSRRRENAADEYALKITENAPSFISAMKKLANQNLADTDPPAWVVWLFYTHPPIGQRVRRGEEFARRQGINPYPDEQSALSA